jgi:hypothetical protein
MSCNFVRSLRALLCSSLVVVDLVKSCDNDEYRVDSTDASQSTMDESMCKTIACMLQSDFPAKFRGPAS